MYIWLNDNSESKSAILILETVLKIENFKGENVHGMFKHLLITNKKLF